MGIDVASFGMRKTREEGKQSRRVEEYGARRREVEANTKPAGDLSRCCVTGAEVQAGMGAAAARLPNPPAH